VAQPASKTTVSVEQLKLVRGALAILQQLMSEKGHGQIVITVRDGMIQLVEKKQTFLPQQLVET
jgi:hypothetical protein